jgi:glutathione S-transferase
LVSKTGLPFGHVEAALADGRRYLLGDQFTTADILLTTCLTWAIDYGVGICSNAVPHLDRVMSRDGYIRSLEANAAKVHAV